MKVPIQIYRFFTISPGKGKFNLFMLLSLWLRTILLRDWWILALDPCMRLEPLKKWVMQDTFWEQLSLKKIKKMRQYTGCRSVCKTNG
jgi:hypothetical protein